ncbi:MAG: bifunctional (p)ppGpp synthetase/guanosine-3',5'-bis(diphosphate) 3'-pyrophosphohydrolase [Acidobacteriota bacterium]|nr:bifunctional (p)ppGpp synthetase/guanosine-3',5'-bis(diphosphate) 3'-pyrophosphohydrolase [Blastocatellia bacterium]MDW8412881.1 bifunctional (p)ppGpp synthetase/guanosine-3',5'-bis(diphosphate) 3'-pyrophosphohydrolase [Acidobacteriota bacterium]
MIRFEDILEKVEKYYKAEDLDLLRRAYLFSAMVHKGQVRKSGEPYLAHPLEVANILAEMRLDVTCVATGLLHDVVEDTAATLEDVEKQFGKEIAHLVDGLTKISQIGYASREESQAETVRKMLLAMVDDIRVVLVKLADRLHNMRTLEYLPSEKRKRKAEETLDIYAPIAHRLGMGRIRGELEDLAFKHLYPEDYNNIQVILERRRPELEQTLVDVKRIIKESLEEAQIPLVEIQGRIKRPYSIFAKLKRQRITIDQVYDLLAVRIITKTVKDCYGALGVIHNIWKPVPGRFKDWIAIPRNNMYQSLHTSVVSENGQPFEVQIRTEEMHRVAEEGIAAHWKYKEQKLGKGENDEAFIWLKRLIEWQQEVPDSREFLDSLKLDLYPQDVYAFTPKGKVIELPRNSTPVDFAYAIHTDIGHTCTGAKVNGRIVSLRYQIRNGDVVEILTQPNSHPSRDWLKFVVTAKARNRIKKYLAESEKLRAIEIGRKLFEKEAERFRLNVKKLLADGDLTRVANEYGLVRPEDLFAWIGYGKLFARNVIAKLIPPEQFQELADKESTLGKVIKKVLRIGDRIRVKGIDEIMVYRARCCNPIRGEKIIGYITRGKGVAVHSVTCSNAKNLMINKERILDVEWLQDDTQSSYSVTISVLTENRQGILADLTAAISNIKTDIRDARAAISPDGHGMIDITAEIYDVKHLERVIKAVKSVPGVLGVERMGGTQQ